MNKGDLEYCCTVTAVLGIKAETVKELASAIDIEVTRFSDLSLDALPGHAIVIHSVNTILSIVQVEALEVVISVIAHMYHPTEATHNEQRSKPSQNKRS